MKTRKNPILSLLLALTIVLSSFVAFAPMAASAQSVAPGKPDIGVVDFSTDNASSGTNSFVESYNPENFAAADLTIQPGALRGEINFNWFSDAGDSASVVQIVKASDLAAGAFPASGVIATANGTFGDAVDGNCWHKAGVAGLDADTEYAFRVSNDSVNFSEVYTFRTGDAGSFTFAAVGDPQIGCSGADSDESIAADAAAWSATVSKIAEKDVSFIAGTGDQIENAAQTASDIAKKSKEYTGFLTGLNQGGTLIPYAPVIGNHEGDGSSAAGPGRALYGAHYNAPNAASAQVNGFTLYDYYYLYNDVLYVVLDTAPYPANAADAKPYIDAYSNMLSAATTAYAGQYDWLVVQTHKSQQSNASHWNDSDINAYSLAGFEDLMTQYNVDLTLMGHDHSYTRTYPFTSNGGPLVTNGITIDQNNMGDTLVDPAGTVYMVLDSSSGSKFYTIHPPQKATSKVECQSNIPQYTMINVNPGKLSISTYEMGTDVVVDSFTMEKTFLSVTFDLNGGNSPAINPINVKAGNTITLPAAPTRTGDANNTYAFVGWFTAPVGGTQFTTATPVTANTTVYAQWAATAKPVVNAIQITGAVNGNGQANVNFAIRSANGKGYIVYLSESGAPGSFKAYSNVNYDAKGAHIKGLTNGRIYYAYIEYTDGKFTEESDVTTMNPGAGQNGNNQVNGNAQ